MWPTAFDHVHMINKGWSHSELSEMSVEEAAFWTRQQAAYDEAAARAGGSGGQ